MTFSDLINSKVCTHLYKLLNPPTPPGSSGCEVPSGTRNPVDQLPLALGTFLAPLFHIKFQRQSHLENVWFEILIAYILDSVWFEVLIAYILDNVWFEVLIAYTLDNVWFEVLIDYILDNVWFEVLIAYILDVLIAYTFGTFNNIGTEILLL